MGLHAASHFAAADFATAAAASAVAGPRLVQIDGLALAGRTEAQAERERPDHGALARAWPG